MKERQLVLLGLVVLILLSFLDSFSGVTFGYEEFVQLRDAAGNPINMSEDGSLPPQAVQKGELEGALTAGQVLKVVLPTGEIDLSGVTDGESTTARLDYEVRVYGKSEEVAQAHAGKVRLELRPVGDGLELVVDEPPRPAGLQVKVVVQGTLPATARVNLQNAYGPVKVVDLSGPSVVRNRYGATELGRLAGDWSVEADYSALRVDGVAGNLDVRCDFGPGTIGHVGGDVTIRSDYKDIRVADVGGNLNVSGDHGSLEFEDVVGSVSLEVDYKNVRGDGIGGDLSAGMSYGNLQLTGLRRNVDIKARYANVDLAFAAPPDHQFSLHSRYGSISDDLSVTEEQNAGRFEKLREGVAGQGRYRVSVETQYGDIRVRETAGSRQKEPRA